MWRQASLPAVEGGILPPGKTIHLSKRSHFTMTFPVTRGSAGLEAPALRLPGWPTLPFSDRLSDLRPPTSDLDFSFQLSKFQLLTG